MDLSFNPNHVKMFSNFQIRFMFLLFIRICSLVRGRWDLYLLHFLKLDEDLLMDSHSKFFLGCLK